MYDAIVVGARCAGSPTAMLLARKGYRVLLVDRATFPSDTLSAHFLHPTGVARLKRWGLLDQVVASNCPAVTRWSLDVGPFVLTGSPPPIDGVAESRCPRRMVLDKLLVGGAVAAGVELREAFTVRELVMEGDRVIGIRGHSRGGALVEEQATLVVGADGLRSVVARAVQAPSYQVRPVVTCAYYTYWSGVAVAEAEIYAPEGRVIFAFPTNDGLICTYLAWPRDEFHSVRADVEGSVLAALSLVPGLAERVRAGKRADRIAGAADLPNFFRKPWGPGWALVGDAGYHKDPYLAQGMSDAFRDAELLVEAIDAGLSGHRASDDALAEYEQRRNEAAMPGYELNYQLATLQPLPTDTQALLSALRGNQAETDRFFGALLGAVPVAEFFAPENTRRIVAA